MSEYFGIHIVRDPEIFSGRPIVARHRISVHDIVALHQRGESTEEMAEAFQLTPLEVRAALAYYQDHQEEIDREIVEDGLEIARRASEDKSPLSKRLRDAGKDRKFRGSYG